MKARVLACYNFKGGVGKTAAAVNLAFAAARDPKRVLIWDLDAQAAATFYFRVEPGFKGGAKKLIGGKRDLEDFIKATNYENLDLMPSDFSYRNLDLYLHKRGRTIERLAQLIAPLRSQYDYVILDCPPGISLVSENIFLAADALIVPLIPTTLSARVYEKLKAFFAKRRDEFHPALLPFFSMTDRRRRLHREVEEEFSHRHPELLRTSVANASSIEQMGRYRAPVQVYAGASPEAKAFDSLWLEIRERLEQAESTS
ncbi:MAG: AAA family ATPase [Gammaproteobacteria bacterium]|nr:AAA family ATPase [Gammaproteobacteria bacterium]